MMLHRRKRLAHRRRLYDGGCEDLARMSALGAEQCWNDAWRATSFTTSFAETQSDAVKRAGYLPPITSPREKGFLI